jgi:nitroimidazol reductase NimA-like FMN-containing flavoprotein (pyridoxamine 5'-phosphate oxidase superfamily)
VEEAGHEFRTRDLTREESNAFLSKARFGRLAFLEGARVTIRPVGIALAGDWLFGRMEPGGKVEALLHNPWIALQVDEVQGPWDWTSVLVHGALHFLEPGAGRESDAVRRQAIEALARSWPGLGGASDPGAHRTLLFGITPQEVSGRRGWLDG